MSRWITRCAVVGLAGNPDPPPLGQEARRRAARRRFHVLRLPSRQGLYERAAASTSRPGPTAAWPRRPRRSMGLSREPGHARVESEPNLRSRRATLRSADLRLHSCHVSPLHRNELTRRNIQRDHIFHELKFVYRGLDPG